MSRFAPVVPLNIATWLKEHNRLGDYHLLLAHDVLAEPDEYQHVYGDLGQGKVIILDNSIIELGAPLGIEDLARASEIIEPDYLVIPDVMGDMQGTIDLAEGFTQEYFRMNGKHDGPHLLAVVHGETILEYRECAQELCKMHRVMALSAPRIATEILGSRMGVVMDLVRWHPHKHLHLLGFSDNILDDVSCARVPGVEGIDSAVPIRAGVKGIELTLDFQIDCGPRGDFWNTTMHPVYAYERTIKDNIDDFREWIDTTGNAEE